MYPILVSALPVSSTMGVISASLPPSILSGIQPTEKRSAPLCLAQRYAKKMKEQGEWEFLVVSC